MFPAFVNCTTIDWFSEWPADALLEVADKYLQEVQIGAEDEVWVIYKNLSSLIKIWLFFYYTKFMMLNRVFCRM
jgi:hypothetical protein